MSEELQSDSIEAFIRANLGEAWTAVINEQGATTPPEEMHDAPPPENPQIPILTFGVETGDRDGRRERWKYAKKRGFKTKAIRPADFDAEKFWGKDVRSSSEQLSDRQIGCNCPRCRGQRDYEIRRIPLTTLRCNMRWIESSLYNGPDRYLPNWEARFSLEYSTRIVHPMEADSFRCHRCGQELASEVDLQGIHRHFIACHRCKMIILIVRGFGRIVPRGERFIQERREREIGRNPELAEIWIEWINAPNARRWDRVSRWLDNLEQYLVRQWEVHEHEEIQARNSQAQT